MGGAIAIVVALFHSLVCTVQSNFNFVSTRFSKEHRFSKDFSVDHLSSITFSFSFFVLRTADFTT